MTTRYKRIDAHFRPQDLELYNFIMSQVNGFGDASQIMREAATCLRTVQLHANGLTWQEWLVKAEAAIKVVDNIFSDEVTK